MLSALVVLSQERRAVVPFAVPAHATAAWVAQQCVEAVAAAETPLRFLIHDRDNIYGETFQRRVEQRSRMTPLGQQMMAALHLRGKSTRTHPLSVPSTCRPSATYVP